MSFLKRAIAAGSLMLLIAGAVGVSAQGASAATSGSLSISGVHTSVKPYAGLPACNALFDGKQVVYGGWLWECVSFPGLPGVWYWKKVRQVACGPVYSRQDTSTC